MKKPSSPQREPISMSLTERYAVNKNEKLAIANFMIHTIVPLVRTLGIAHLATHSEPSH
jgi:hypothetical protein